VRSMDDTAMREIRITAYFFEDTEFLVTKFRRNILTVISTPNNLFKGSVCPFHMYRLLIGGWVETKEKGLALRADDTIKNPGIFIAYYLRKIPTYQRMLLGLVSGTIKR
jgi:hypothetical protein